MRVRALRVLAGGNGVRRPGQVFDVPDDEGRALLGAGAVERVDPAPRSEPEIETAEAQPAPEIAAERVDKPAKAKVKAKAKAKAKRKPRGK